MKYPLNETVLLRRLPVLPLPLPFRPQPADQQNQPSHAGHAGLVLKARD